MDHSEVFFVFSEFWSPCTGKSTRCPCPPGRRPPPDSRPPAQMNGTQIKLKFPSSKYNEGVWSPPVHRDLLLLVQSHRRRNFQSHPTAEECCKKRNKETCDESDVGSKRDLINQLSTIPLFDK